MEPLGDGIEVEVGDADDLSQEAMRTSKDEGEGGADEDVADEDDCDFSFVAIAQHPSPIPAEEIFTDGVAITSSFPLFDQSLLFTAQAREFGSPDAPSLRSPLRKLFSEQQGDGPDTAAPSSSGTAVGDGEIAGPYCEWYSGKPVVESSGDGCGKSSSTGFSRMWRFRDLGNRSSSDGKDAFVFLNRPAGTARQAASCEGAPEKPEAASNNKKPGNDDRKGRANGRRGRAAAWANGRNGEGARRTYLPYRQNLLGFFSNGTGMTRNVHPF